jgi:hypothetical protein
MKKNIRYTMFFEIMLPSGFASTDAQTVFLFTTKAVLLHKKALNPL